ncbi:MAG: hypothetical protein ACLQF0_09185 [Dissulfurispiraceae bacterium]
MSGRVTLINTSAIKRLAHSRGFQVTTDTLKALDEIVESQVERAIFIAIGRKRKRLDRGDYSPLFPAS